MTSNVGSVSTQQDPMSIDITEQAPCKKIIKFNQHGCPVGDNATHFQDRIGRFVKTFASIRYADWRKVPRNYKDDVWKLILREFEVPHHVKKHVQKSMSRAFRKLKCDLRKRYLDKWPNLEAKILNVPPKIKKEDWEQFCINEDDEKQKKRREKNAENRTHSVYGHTGGRKSAAMIEEEMREKQKDPTIPITRTDVWIATHTRKDGTTLHGAESFMIQVKAKAAETIQSENNSNVHPLSIDDDPLSQVFGKEPRGGVRGAGSHISKRQYDDTLHARIMYSEQKVTMETITKKYDRMETKLDFVVDYINKCNAKEVDHGGISIPNTPTMMMNPTVPSSGEGNSETSPHNEQTPSARLCELLDWDQNCVAVAREITDPVHRGNCHNIIVDPLIELKVSMVARKMFGAKLYKKIYDANKIGDVECGGFLVWPKSHIKFVE